MRQNEPLNLKRSVRGKSGVCALRKWWNFTRVLVLILKWGLGLRV